MTTGPLVHVKISEALEGLLLHYNDTSNDNDVATRYSSDDEDASPGRSYRYCRGGEEDFLAALSHELSLLQQQQQQQQQEPSSNVHVRDILGDSAYQLVEVLAPLLQDRVHMQTLLPSTQDVDAEREVLDETTNAQTLTRTAMHAGWLYAQLLALPGALGSGLVDLQLLSSLGALLRRWSLETCGRESELGRVSVGRQMDVPSPSKSPPKKKTRHSRQIQDDDSLDDNEDDDNTPSSSSILHVGLQIAYAVTAIPLQKEFGAWSYEAKEQVLEALIAAFGTAAALQSVLAGQGNQITTQASKAWQASLLHTNAHKTRQHETTVLIARGLLHLLQFKEIMPCGERGKLDAHTAASAALQDLMEGFTRQQGASNKYNQRLSLGDATNTPARRRRRSSGGLITPATSVGKTPGRRRRSSIEGVPTGAGTTSTTLLSPAALKGRRSSMGITATPSSADHVKPRPVWSVFVGLLQKIATTPGMERATSRTHTIECLINCIPALPLAERAHFLRYLLKLTNSKVSLHRLVVCELLGKILVQDWLRTHQDDFIAVKHDTSTTSPKTPVDQDSEVSLRLPLALWKALQGRLVDKLAPVRARAAASIELVVPAHPEWLEENTLLLNQLRKRALKDETATVRKAALLALRQVIHTLPDYLTETTISTICELCQDHDSILTRKVAAESLTGLLTEFLDHPSAALLEQAWSTCVLPMVLEDDVAGRAINGLDQVVVTPLLASSRPDDCDHQQEQATTTAWRLLAHVASASGSQGASKGARHALQMGLKQLALEHGDRIHKDLWKVAANVAQTCSMQNESSEAQIMGAWCLLETMLSSAPAKQVKSMVVSAKRSHLLDALCGKAWKALLDRCGGTPHVWLLGTLRSCLMVITQLAPGLDTTVVGNIHSDLSNELQHLSFRPEVAGAAISALSAISIRLDPEQARLNCQIWIQATYQECQKELMDCVKYEMSDRAIRALFLVGELNMVGFRPDDDENSPRINDTDVLRGVHEQPPQKLQELVQTLLPPTLPGSSTDTPTTIRAHAFTVLGKLCLRDEALAKQSLNLLARELHPSLSNPNPSVQSNALLVLGDLCVRYTNMADRYLPVMASCLQSGSSDPEMNLLGPTDRSSAITRKHAVLLLSSLLLQDYIKWRGLLFHRFLVACSDEDEQVAALAESVLSGPLCTRQPKLFFNHFVEALFVLNKCTAHPMYISAASQGDGGSGIAVGFEGIYLDGDLGRLRRHRMYDFMLSKLTDEEKIGVTARLAKEVLAEAISQEGDLSRVCQSRTPDQLLSSRALSCAWNVLTDAFYILTCPQLKVGRMNNEDDENANLEDPNVLPNANHQVSLAKTRLLSKISRKHLIEIVLPIVCQLKSKLQMSCSPLLKDLQMYLLDIFRRYKKEVREFLANDPQLLQEMEYDARQFAAGVSAE